MRKTNIYFSREVVSVSWDAIYHDSIYLHINPYVAGGATFAFTASGTVVALGSVAGASTFAGLAAGSWTVVGIATTATSAATSLILDMTVKQAEALQKATKDFLAGANKRLRPGERYDSGKMTLSLVRTCWLMNENGEQVKRAVWTAPTANANHDYKASTWAWTQPDIIKLVLKYDD